MKQFIVLLLTLALAGCSGREAVVCNLETPRLGSWGDQGDGTFRNPILNSNFPDSDVEQLGDKWYMISSRGTSMKGMTILESEDLVNWEIAGGIVDSITWKTRTGVWAGDLVHRGDHWLCYFIDFEKGLFVCKSEDIRGPWSAPHLIFERAGMTDPAVFWDEEQKQAYLLCNYQIDELGLERVYHQRLFRLSWDGFELLDEGKDVYVGVGAEAAKIYRINDLYYIFISEWTMDGKGHKVDRRQIVLRAPTIDGPYEKRVLLERGNGTMRSCSQGSLVQAPDGSWWYFHQLVQSSDSFEGRPQFLIPVHWKDGWPLLGEDTDGNGIGNTIWQARKPIQGKPVRGVQTDDDFSGEELSPQWGWTGNPIAGKWSLTERRGCLRLYGMKPTNPKAPQRSVPNRVIQRKMGRAIDTMTTKMSVEAMADGQRGGLMLTGANHAAVGVEKSREGYRVYLDTTDGMVYSPNFEGTWVWLRTTLEQREGTALYSLDGEHFEPIGNSFTMTTAGFNGIFISLFSMNEAERGYVDFDWFTYDYDGPKHLALDLGNNRRTN